MRKKKNRDEEEIIIGYNTKKKKDKPPKKKDKKSKRKKKNTWRKVKKVLLLLLKIILIIGILAGIGAFLFVSPVFNITEIRVENSNKISENTYISLSEIQIGENIFRISKSKIIEQIKQESYVENVEVKREYPGTVVITVTERTPAYMIEKNGGMYAYIDKNGYNLETTTQALDIPILKGTITDIENLETGARISDEDLSKFNDLIRIMDGIKNNNIQEKLLSVDISDDKNYILEFKNSNKKVILGDTSELSTKMLWIKYFMEKSEEEAGTVHLNDIENVYFEPTR